ncbi:MAG: recombinase family protein [Ruminococcus sp.]|nr:recombinase family protein [Ruminococcus sp.]
MARKKRKQSRSEMEKRSYEKQNIDENTAPNVRRMFEMRAKGASSPQIAKALNADKTITPSDYMYQRLGKPNPYPTTHL